MSTQPQVIGLPNSFDSYIRNGWSLVPIPPGSKGPRTADWNRPGMGLKSSADLPAAWGVGLAHAYSGTMALDIDEWDAAAKVLKEHDIDLNALYDAPDSVIIDSGRAGHGKLLYAMPFGSTMTSRKVTDQTTGKVIYELRCASANGYTHQDVLPPSMHPLTNQPYRWAGKGHYSRLPTIPAELLTLWTELNDRDTQRTIPQAGTPLDTSWAEIRRALFHIDASCSHDEWLACGMALHYAGTHTKQEAQAFFLWDEWSQQSTKYPGQHALGVRWASFRADKDSGIRLGTLFHLAGLAGYKPPPLDVRDLFKSVKSVSPLEFMESMRTPAPVLNTDLMPEIIYQRGMELSVSINVDPAQPMFAGLVAASAALDARHRLELAPGYRVPPVLWVMSIGNPASKKTPASGPMFEALQKIEVSKNPAYRAAFDRWEVMSIMFEKSKAARLKAAEQSDFILASNAAGGPDMEILPQVSFDPGVAPVPTRLLVKDITSQKLARMLAERPYGMCALLDEMKGWTDRVTNVGSGDDRSTWTKAYEAKHEAIDRVGERDPIQADNFALSIFGNIQPAVYREVQKKLGSDGLLQRFIQVPLGNEPYEGPKPVPEMFTSSNEWEKRIFELYEIKPCIIQLSDDARVMFEEFQLWHLRNRQIESTLQQQNNLYLEAYGKLEGLVGRICLVMHMVDYGRMDNMPMVSVDTMRKAILLVKTYVIPAYRYALGEIAGSIEETFDVWLFKHIIQCSGEYDTLTLSDIVRSGRRQLENLNMREKQEIVNQCMTRIVQMGYAIEVQRTVQSTVWAINPNLATLHVDYRQSIIDAKQKQRDDYRETLQQIGVVAKRQYALGYKPTSKPDSTN